MVQLTKFQLLVVVVTTITLTHLASRVFVLELHRTENCQQTQRNMKVGGNVPIIGDGKSW